MTTFASPLAEAQSKLAGARNAARAAKIALNLTTAARMDAESAYKHEPTVRDLAEIYRTGFRGR